MDRPDAGVASRVPLAANRSGSPVENARNVRRDGSLELRDVTAASIAENNYLVTSQRHVHRTVRDGLEEPRKDRNRRETFVADRDCGKGSYDIQC